LSWNCGKSRIYRRLGRRAIGQSKNLMKYAG
jgi:hypothetical protein